MLNLGLIGDIELLEPFAHKIHEHPEIHIAGKSSVGMNADSGSFRFSIPEFNRIELIERSDALLINRFSLLPFPMLRDIIKKSKHIFAVEYPDLPPEECRQLAKLATEAKTVVRITNPFFFLPAVQWLKRYLKNPAYMDISFFKPGNEGPGELMPLLMMLTGFFPEMPRRIVAVSFHSSPVATEFTNARLEMGDASAVNIHFGKAGAEEVFKMNAWSTGQVIALDFSAGYFSCNGTPVHHDFAPGGDEFDLFVKQISGKNSCASGLEDYITALQILQKIQDRLGQFSSSRSL